MISAPVGAYAFAMIEDKSVRRKAVGALKPNGIRLKRGTEAGPLFHF